MSSVVTLLWRQWLYFTKIYNFIRVTFHSTNSFSKIVGPWFSIPHCLIWLKITYYWIRENNGQKVAPYYLHKDMAKSGFYQNKDLFWYRWWVTWYSSNAVDRLYDGPYDNLDSTCKKSQNAWLVECMLVRLLFHSPKLQHLDLCCLSPKAKVVEQSTHRWS